MSYRSWRLCTLRRLFLSSKDCEHHLGYQSRSFSHNPELLFTKQTPANLSGNNTSASHQTIANASSSSSDQRTHNADSPIFNEAENSMLDATNSATQNPRPKSPRATIRHTKGPEHTLLGSRVRSLPKSPFLNPENEDEPPHKQRKAQPTVKDLDRLRYNPWATALASNVRLCAASGYRMPKNLLLSFGLIRHPESKNLWFLPKDLIAEELAATLATTEKPEAVDVTNAKKEGSGESATASDPDSQPNRAKGESIRKVTQAPKIYILDRAAVMKDLSSPAKAGNEKVQRLIPLRWKMPVGKLGTKDAKSLVWREDMPEFVLGALRKKVVKTLKKACLKNREVEDRAGVWRVIKIAGDVVNEKELSNGLEQIGELKGMGSGGVLVLGSRAMRNEDAKGHEEGGDPIQAAARSPLPDLITLPIHGSQVPVFDLRYLLSESDIVELQQRHNRFGEIALFFSPRENVRVDALLALWRLKSFVMYDKDI